MQLLNFESESWGLPGLAFRAGEYPRGYFLLENQAFKLDSGLFGYDIVYKAKGFYKK